jgi:hypothetical protein
VLAVLLKDGHHLGQQAANLHRASRTQEQSQRVQALLIGALCVAQLDVAACQLQTKVASAIQHTVTLCCLRQLFKDRCGCRKLSAVEKCSRPDQSLSCSNTSPPQPHRLHLLFSDG